MELTINNLKNYHFQDILYIEYTEKVFKTLSIVIKIKESVNPIFIYFIVATKEEEYEFNDLQKAIDKYNSITEN